MVNKSNGVKLMGRPKGIPAKQETKDKIKVAMKKKWAEQKKLIKKMNKVKE